MPKNTKNLFLGLTIATRIQKIQYGSNEKKFVNILRTSKQKQKEKKE